MKRLFAGIGIGLMLCAAGTAFGAEPEVEIFVTSWCPYCLKLENFLKQREIEYTRYDIERDAKGADIFTKIGGEGVPVSRVGRQVIHGYDPESILAAIQKKA